MRTFIWTAEYAEVTYPFCSLVTRTEIHNELEFLNDIEKYLKIITQGWGL